MAPPLHLYDRPDYAHHSYCPRETDPHPHDDKATKPRYIQHVSCASLDVSDQASQSSTQSGGVIVDRTCESVHYHHRDHCNDVPYVDSCHTRVDPMVDHQLPEHTKQASTPWCHVFKSSTPSSLRTQAASVAHLQPISGLKSTHRRSRRAKRKHSKQQQLLRECFLTREKSLMLSLKEIRDQCIVFDGGDEDTPRILPPDGFNWHCIRVGMEISIEDEVDPQVGLLHGLIMPFHLLSNYCPKLYKHFFFFVFIQRLYSLSLSHLFIKVSEWQSMELWRGHTMYSVQRSEHFDFFRITCFPCSMLNSITSTPATRCIPRPLN